MSSADDGGGEISVKVSGIGDGTPLAKAETSTQLSDRRIRTHGQGVKPPYNPDRLASFHELNETLSVGIRKKARYEVGYGFQIAPHVDVEADEASDDERETIRDFWRGIDSRWQTKARQKAEPTTPAEVLELARQDYHLIGWCCLEILTDMEGTPVGLAHVPANTVRVRKPQTRFDQPRHPEEGQFVGGDGAEFASRGYVQIRNGRRRYFGEAGDRWRGRAEDDDRDPVFVDRETGDVATESAELLENAPANELIFVTNPSPLADDYGIPDWVSAIRTITADEAAKDYNRDFFDNDTIPRMVVKVTGGELKEESKRDLRQMLNGLREESHRAVVLEVEKFVEENALETEDGDDVEIAIEPLGQGISEEMDFRQFREKNEAEIAKVLEVPPVKIGNTESANRSNSDQQDRDFAIEVIQPEQHKFAERLYQILHQQAFGIRDWTIEFALKGADQPKEEASVARRKIQAVRGAIPINRALEMVGEDPLPEDHPVDGDTLVANVGQEPQDEGPGIEQARPDYLPPEDNKIGERDWADVEAELVSKDPIETTQFDSSNLDEALFDFGANELYLSFLREGGQSSLYAYTDVPTAEWSGLVNASSAGSYHHDNIRLDYPYVEISNFHDRLPEGEIPDDPPDDVPNLSAIRGGQRDFSERRKTPEGVPDDAYSISDESECDGTVHEGPRGGLYCSPDDDGDGDGVSVPETPQEAAELQERVESGAVVEDSSQFWAGRAAEPDIWEHAPPDELENGEIVRAKGSRSTLDDYHGEVVDTDPDADPPTATLETDGGEAVTVETGMYGSYNTYTPDEEGIEDATTPTQIFDETVSSMTDDQRATAVGHVVQHSNASNSRLPQYETLLDSLSEDELHDAVIEWSTKSSPITGGHSSLSIRDLSESDPADASDETPTRQELSAHRLGYLFSRMEDDEQLRDAVDSAYDELSERGDDAQANIAVTSAAIYGGSADARREIYEEYSDEIESTTDRRAAAVEMQFTDDLDEFKELAVGEWVRSEAHEATHHLVQATQEIGANTEDNSESFTTFTNNQSSNGIPLASVEPAEEFEENINQLREETAEYYEGSGPPELYRGVSQETTTHGTLESWSKSKSVARSFDGHAVLEAEVEPEDILISEDVMGDGWPDPENVTRSEQEAIVFGGAFA